MATAIEYGLIAALIAVAAVGAITVSGERQPFTGDPATINMSGTKLKAYAPANGAAPPNWVTAIRDGNEYVQNKTGCYRIRMDFQVPVVDEITCDFMRRTLLSP